MRSHLHRSADYGKPDRATSGCAAILADVPRTGLCPVALDHWQLHDHPVTLLHFPKAAPLSLTRGRVVSRSRHCFYHTADTLPGSSGAPIFVVAAGRWHLVGVHSEAVNVAVGHRTVPFNAGCCVAQIVQLMARLGYRCVGQSGRRGSTSRRGSIRGGSRC